MNPDNSPYASFVEKYGGSEGQAEQRLTPEQTQLIKEFNTEVLAATPASGWGETAFRSSRAGFRKTVTDSLESHFNGQEGQADELISTMLQEQGYGLVYTIKAHTAEELGKSEQQIWNNHQPEAIAAAQLRLTELADTLDTRLASLPLFIRDELRAKIEKELSFCRFSEIIGTADFTKVYTDTDRWQQLLDHDALERGEIKMKYEDDALYVLQQNKLALEKNVGGKESREQYASISAAFEYWQLSESEYAQVQVSEEQLAGKQISVEQLQRLFEVLLRRSPHLKDWQAVIDESKVVMDVNAKARKISLPPGKVYGPDQVVFLPSHELIHIIGGENGDKQVVGTLRTGMDDYLPTEEGKAVLSEMIAGQKFGHPRQVKMAARYYAVALALKTKIQEDGTVVAAHSMQDIYNKLREFQLSVSDAQEVVWRIMCGTSLTRKAVETEVAPGKSLFVGEVYPKDVVYFEGQLAMLNHFINEAPLQVADRKRLDRLNTRDVSRQLLARVGRQAFLGQAGSAAAERYSSRQEQYQALISLGRDTLLRLLQYSLVGKINWDTIQQQPEWQQLFTHDQQQLVQIKAIVSGSS